MEPWAITYLQSVVEESKDRKKRHPYVCTDVTTEEVLLDMRDRTVSVFESLRSRESERSSRVNRDQTTGPDRDRDTAKPVKTRLPALQTLLKYAKDHVLLRGNPGSGKTTTLRQLLFDEADRLLSDGSSFEESAASRSGPIPVFVELKYLADDPIDLIATALNRHHDSPSQSDIEKCLRTGRLLLLLDGFNEIPSSATGEERLVALRRRYPSTPMIFSSRGLMGAAGLTFGYEIELESLTEKQIREFIGAYLPEEGQAAAMLRALRAQGSRVAKLAETPLFLMMLCELFRCDRNLPSCMGDVLEKWIEEVYWPCRIVDLPSAAREKPNWDCLVQRLAVEMNRKGTTVLTFEEARQVTEPVLKDLGCRCAPADVDRWLNEVGGHHIIQMSGDRSIGFPHQLIQEFYAAVWLRSRLLHDSMSVEELKRDYLNLVKWTETVAIMASVMDDQAQAVRIVRAALEVDLLLGSRLAGEVSPEFQRETVDLVSELPLPPCNKIFLLGQTKSEAAVRHVEPWLHHLANKDRAVAAEALGNLGSEKAVQPLIDLLDYEENDDVRQNAAEALGVLGNDKAVQPLIDLLGERSLNVGGKAAEALGKLGSDQAVQPLIKMLGVPDKLVRYRAAEALEKLGSEKAVQRLIDLLRVRDNLLRYMAAEALGKLGSDQAVQPLIKMLADPDEWVRQSAAEALGKLGSDQAVRPLVKRLSDLDERVRQSAAEALGKLGSDQAVERLIELLSDSDYRVRWVAAWALGKLGSEKAVQPLIRMLSDSDYRFRREAAEALGKLGSDKAVQPLIRMLSDSDYRFRREAAEALGKLGSEKAVQPLVDLLGNPDESVRYVAAEALGKLGSEKAVQPLIDLLGDTVKSVRYVAAEALGKLGSEKAVQPLVDLLGNPDESVRYVAAEALGKLGSDKAVQPLIDLLGDTVESVRYMGAEALGRLVIRTTHEDLLRILLKVDDPKLFHIMSEEQAELGYYRHHLWLETEGMTMTVGGGAVTILHLSDLHFRNDDDVEPWLLSLTGDLRGPDLRCDRLDAVVFSGDISSKTQREGYQAAVVFTKQLMDAFQVTPERLIVVPGNHDVSRKISESAHDRAGKLRSRDHYKQRFLDFSEGFHEQVFAAPYPLEYNEQFRVALLSEARIVIVGINSAWEIDHKEPARANIQRTAISRALKQVRDRCADWTKIVVWHHPVHSNEEARIKQDGLVQTLVDDGFCMLLHGHVHKDKPETFLHGRGTGARQMWLVPAGSFGAAADDLARAYPWQYNVIRIEAGKAKIFSRIRQEPDGPWGPMFYRPSETDPPRAYWEIDL